MFKNFAALSRASSFIALLLIFLNIYLVLILDDLSASGSERLIQGISFFSLTGVALSSFLCPFFLPSPGRRKSYRFSMVFIVSIILPNIILRSFGAELFVSSMPVRAAASFLSGMLYPPVTGLFFMIHQTEHSSQKANKPVFNIFLFSLAPAAGVLARHFFIPLLELSGILTDPKKAMSLAFNVIRWQITVIGIAGIIAVLFLPKDAGSRKARPVKTNWPIIFRLIGLAVVYKLSNAVMDFRLFPFLSGSAIQFKMYSLLMAALIPVFAYIAGFSIERFLKWFLPLAMALFILLPCLPLFDSYPGFIIFMNILVSIFNFMVWVVFTAALLENYAGGFWFYGLSSVIYFSNIFLFSFLFVARHIPAGIEYTVLIALIAAIAFLFLALKILFPKATVAASSPVVPLEEFFNRHGLSRREIEVAFLLAEEGLGNKEIAQRLYISPLTVKDHIAQIYRKFEVKTRTEFMAAILKRENTKP